MPDITDLLGLGMGAQQQVNDADALGMLGGGGQAQPLPTPPAAGGQGMPAPTPPTANGMPVPMAGGGIQQGNNLALQNLQQMLGQLSAVSPAEKAAANAISYTPEKRKEDKMAVLLGRKKPVLDQSGRATYDDTGRPVLQDTGKGSKVLGGITQALMQIGGQGGPEVRARRQGLEEYKAEATPEARMLGYEAANRRNLETNIRQQITGIQKAMADQARIEVQKQVADIRGKLASSQQDLFDARIRELDQRGDLEGQRKLAVAMQTSKTATERDFLLKYGPANGYQLPSFLAQMPEKDQKAYLDHLGQIETEKKKSKYPPASLIQDRFQFIQDPASGGIFRGATAGPHAGTITPVTGSSIGQSTADKLAFDPTSGKPILPPMPGLEAKMEPGDAPKVAGAIQVFANIKEMQDELKKIATKGKIGTVVGNFEKYIKGNTSGADPDIARFAALANVLAVNHAAITGRPAYQFLHEIEGKVGKLGTNPQALGNVLSAFNDSAETRLRSTPQSETQFRKAFQDKYPEDVLRLYYNKLYQQLVNK